MGAEHLHDWRPGMASALEWWRDAGVDTLVDDDPRDWLARPAVATAAQAQQAVAAAAPVEILPTTLDDFIEWRFGPAAPESDWHTPLIRPTGPAKAGLVIFTDMPCPGDRDTLMSGPTGRVFDRMLAAIGLDRDSVYLGSLAVARPVSGRLLPEQEARLIQLARHHLTLLRPELLLLLGKPAELLIDSGDGLSDINLFGCTTRAVATYHPRFLLEGPAAAKSEAWKHLLLLTRGGQ